jgi:hypothetical protein
MSSSTSCRTTKLCHGRMLLIQLQHEVPTVSARASGRVVPLISV